MATTGQSEPLYDRTIVHVNHERNQAPEIKCAQMNPHGVEGSNDQTAYWRNMFLALQNERETAAEAQLHALMAEIPKREQSLKNYAVHLEGQICLHKEERDNAKQEVIDLKEQLDDTLSEMRQKKEEIERYHMLTSMTLSNTSNSDVQCTILNKVTNQRAEFRISSLGNTVDNDKRAALSKYEPVKDCEKLPIFLQSAIEFETNECPSLLQNILKSLF